MSKILVVEDDKVSLKLITSILEKEEHEVLTAFSGKDAIGQLEKGLVDLIILDVMMPGMDGMQFLKYLKSVPRLSRIPVIMCTALHDAKTVTTIAEMGIQDYITKPIKKEVLLEKVKKVLKQGTDSVLIVDDEKLIQNLLSRAVEREGLKAITASSGEEALDLLDKYKVKLVISDISMPGMNGLELLVKIKEKYPTLPVLLITGHAGQYTKEEVLAAGADSYITKPFKNIEIAQRLVTYIK